MSFGMTATANGIETKDGHTIFNRISNIIHWLKAATSSAKLTEISASVPKSQFFIPIICLPMMVGLSVMEIKMRKNGTKMWLPLKRHRISCQNRTRPSHILNGIWQIISFSMNSAHTVLHAWLADWLTSSLVGGLDWRTDSNCPQRECVKFRRLLLRLLLLFHSSQFLICLFD